MRAQVQDPIEPAIYCRIVATRCLPPPPVSGKNTPRTEQPPAPVYGHGGAGRRYASDRRGRMSRGAGRLEKTSPDYVAASRPAHKPRRARSRFDGLAGVIWPQRSLITGREVAGPGALEPEHWTKLHFLSDPFCACCGTPLDLAVEEGQLCGACLASRPAYDRARAALAYGDVSRDLVLALKYQGRRDSLDLLARWMAAAGGRSASGRRPDRPRSAALLSACPARLQPVGLAGCRVVARAAASAFRVDALKRVRATPIQGGLSADGRRRNVQGAFRVRKRQGGPAQG